MPEGEGPVAFSSKKTVDCSPHVLSAHSQTDIPV